jgi:DNA-binding response OmpR family regulator
MQILVVQDDPDVADFIRQGLERDGHAVATAVDGDSALSLLLTEAPYDLVVLDILLPKRNGLSVLQTARRRGLTTPVLVLSARDSTGDKVAGLDLGADDYLTKPFELDEFLARVRALLRRGGPHGRPALALADLTLDPALHAVTRGGRCIDLTAREYSLLEYFLRNAGQVLTRVRIAEHVWGLSFDCESNIIDVYVGHLRRKLDAGSRTPLLHSVRGIGYVLRVGPSLSCSLPRAG